MTLGPTAYKKEKAEEDLKLQQGEGPGSEEPGVALRS